jgi:hypothetical protein
VKSPAARIHRQPSGKVGRQQFANDFTLTQRVRSRSTSPVSHPSLLPLLASLLHPSNCFFQDNLSLLMRSLFGIGTPKQAQARLYAVCCWLLCLASHLRSKIAAFSGVIRKFHGLRPAPCPGQRFACFSTGC